MRAIYYKPSPPPTSAACEVIALTGGDGGDIASLLDVQDIELCVQVESRTRIHEIHLLCLYSLCDLIDHTLFGMD